MLIAGCSGVSAPEPALWFEPTLLEISPDAATGLDYIVTGSIDGAEEQDYFKLALRQPFNSVVVMTAGDTDTAGQIETADRTPITAECQGDPWKAAPPCVWGQDADSNTPNPDRSERFNSMSASKNFLWVGSLGVGTYYIRVTGATGATGATGDYELTVELKNQDCPDYYCD